jgi:SAM-dependent methyltransferase
VTANAIDWAALERLRAAFLEGRAGATDYWRSDSDLASYDATYAQRIGWKWDYVLSELARRGWSPPGGTVLDWGCGTGIAHRAYLDHFGTGAAVELALWDRSARAMEFAAKRARAKFPQLNSSTGLRDAPTVLLISHVLTELDDEKIAALTDLAARATCVIWVEPGTHECSRRLIAVREQLRSNFNVIAPCTHQSSCGMLAPDNAAHWCHHFADPPAAVFTDPDWGRFAHETGIDLRSLPVSFVVLDRRPAPVLPVGAARVIGRARVYKAHALVLGCTADGVRDVRVSKRALPEPFRQMKKGTFAPLQVWRTEGEEVVSLQPLDSAPAHPLVTSPRQT